MLEVLQRHVGGGQQPVPLRIHIHQQDPSGRVGGLRQAQGQPGQGVVAIQHHVLRVHLRHGIDRFGRHVRRGRSRRRAVELHAHLHALADDFFGFLRSGTSHRGRFAVDLSRWPRILAIDAACGRIDALRRAAPSMQPDAG